MITAHLTVRNLEEAWITVMREIMHRGREYRKDDSTRAGMLRKALDFVSVEITHPEDRPLVPLSKPGCVSLCNEEDAERYLLEKLYTDAPPAPNEAYTYAQWLMPGIRYTTDRYAQGGFYTQKATMAVGNVFDDMWKCAGDQSIPCLRMIDTRIINESGVDRLHYYIVFRCWNWFGAFSLEMSGFQMLKEVHCVLISEAAGKEVVPGPTVAISKDVHCNEIEWDAARAWLGE
ncbi:MAG: hypothetical protein WC356_02395 [Candidatus Micrarchaeia archaeon]